MPFSNPIIGGGGALIRDAIQSPDFVAGSTGWQIARDGSAEFNDVTVRGTLETGAAGTAHVSIPDGLAEVDLINAAGAVAKIASQTTAGIAGFDASTSAYILTGAPSGSTTGASKMKLRKDLVDIGFFRASDDSGYGGAIRLQPDVVQVGPRDLGGGDTGGQLYLDALGFTLSEGPDLTNMIFADGSGIRSAGTFVSSGVGSFTAGTGWSLTEQRVDRWGPFVCVHIMLTRTGADIAAGNIADVTIATLSDDRPQSQTSCAAQWFAGTAAVSLDSAGNMALRWLASLLATGDALRVDTAYFKP